MAWVSVHQQIRDHRKTRELFRRLNISRPEAIGILVLIWLWAIDNASRVGELISCTKEDIADAAYWKGNVDEFYSALVNSKWIDEIDGKMFLHDWEEFNKPFHDYIKRKENDKERKRQHNFRGNSVEIRADIPQEFHDSPSPSPSPSPSLDIININNDSKKIVFCNNVFLTSEEHEHICKKFDKDRVMRTTHFIVKLSKKKTDGFVPEKDDYNELIKMINEELEG